MPPKRRNFKRPPPERRYRKLFVIATEGVKTEFEYFAIFNSESSTIRVKCIKGSHGCSPPQVLKRMEKYIKQQGLDSLDEAWIVVDKDEWTDQQLSLLHQWAENRVGRGFALSNPKFEYWLLLHFEDGTDILSPRDCDNRLKRYIPEYDKGIDCRIFSNERIYDAVKRAENRDTPPCCDWPRNCGSTVYRLVKNILRENNPA